MSFGNGVFFYSWVLGLIDAWHLCKLTSVGCSRKYRGYSGSRWKQKSMVQTHTHPYIYIYIYLSLNLNRYSNCIQKPGFKPKIPCERKIDWPMHVESANVFLRHYSGCLTSDSNPGLSCDQWTISNCEC